MPRFGRAYSDSSTASEDALIYLQASNYEHSSCVSGISISASCAASAYLAYQYLYPAMLDVCDDDQVGALAASVTVCLVSFPLVLLSGLVSARATENLGYLTGFFLKAADEVMVEYVFNLDSPNPVLPAFYCFMTAINLEGFGLYHLYHFLKPVFDTVFTGSYAALSYFSIVIIFALLQIPIALAGLAFAVYSDFLSAKVFDFYGRVNPLSGKVSAMVANAAVCGALAGVGINAYVVAKYLIDALELGLSISHLESQLLAAAIIPYTLPYAFFSGAVVGFLVGIFLRCISLGANFFAGTVLNSFSYTMNFIESLALLVLSIYVLPLKRAFNCLRLSFASGNDDAFEAEQAAQAQQAIANPLALGEYENPFLLEEGRAGLGSHAQGLVLNSTEVNLIRSLGVIALSEELIANDKEDDVFLCPIKYEKIKQSAAVITAVQAGGQQYVFERSALVQWHTEKTFRRRELTVPYPMNRAIQYELNDIVTVTITPSSAKKFEPEASGANVDEANNAVAADFDRKRNVKDMGLVSTNNNAFLATLASRNTVIRSVSASNLASRVAAGAINFEQSRTDIARSMSG